MVQNAPMAYPVLPAENNFVRSAPPVAQTPKRRMYQALHQYKATREDELSFEPGDLIAVFNYRDDGWYEGVLGKYQGLFPGNYVKECS